METEKSMTSQSPVDPALLAWAEYWYPISWKGLLFAGVLAAISAFFTLSFFALQWRTTTIRERHADWRTALLEDDAAQAKKDAAKANEQAGLANERSASLEREAAVLRLELNREIQKHAQRLLTDEQKEAMVSQLRGKLPEVAIVTQNDIEAQAFSMQILGVFSNAGVKMYAPQAPREDRWFAPAGLLMYSPSGSTEDQLKDDPLYLTLKKANLFGGTMGAPFVSGQPRIPEMYLIQGYKGPVLYVGQKSPF